MTPGALTRARILSSPNFGESQSMWVSIGGQQATFTVMTTTFVPDTTPNAFKFQDQEVLLPNGEVISNTITISGINTPSRMTITGGEYNIIGTSGWFSGATNVTNGKRIRVRHTSSLLPTGSVNTVLTVGGVSDTFTSTGIPDLTPNQFTFTDKTGVNRNSTMYSNQVTLTSFTLAATIQITGGEYSLNGGSWTTNPGIAQPGDKVKLRHKSATTALTRTDTTLTVSGVAETFSTTTK